MLQILMDIDETMVSVPPGINALSSKNMFKKVYGVEAHEEMVNNVGKTELSIVREVLAKVGVQIDSVTPDAYSVWADCLKEELLKKPVRVLPGIREFLDSVSVLPQVKLRLLTGNAPGRAFEKIASGGLEKYFLNADNTLDGVFGDEAPKRDMLFDILRSKSNKDDIFVVVDDSLLGAEMGKKYSLPMILIATGHVTEKQLRSYSDTVFPDLGDNSWNQAVSYIQSLI